MIEAPTMIEITTIDAQGLATTHEVVRMTEMICPALANPASTAS